MNTGPDNTITLAVIGILGATTTAIIWVAKYALTKFGKDLQEHTKASIELKVAAEGQTKASEQVLIFMKGLNGRLAKITAQTIHEQTVEHQKVNESVINKAQAKE